MCPHPGEFALFLKKNANALGLTRGGWALLEMTDALNSGKGIAMAICPIIVQFFT